jgi:drug/metabolite transporter (DMT)-like permease
MFGITIAIVASILFTLSDVGKKSLSQTLSAPGMIFSAISCALLTNGTYLICSDSLLFNFQELWAPLCFCAAGTVVGELAFMYGIKRTDLSLAKPLSAIFPVFVAFAAYALFGELPTSLGALGVLTIVVGAYLLGTKPPYRRHVMLPIYLLRRNQGCQMIVLAALIGAIVMVVQKNSSQHASGILFFTLMLGLDWIIFAFLVLRHGFLLPGAKLSRSNIWAMLLSGSAWGIAGALAYTAFAYALSAYVAAALQIGVLLAIILGGVVFKEKDILQRLCAGCIMLVGICMVALGGL